MVEKVVLLICDGLGDRPIDELGALTPLEAAETPCLDRLARESECGLMYPLGRGLVPGSDVAHLAILGYDPQEYYAGRGTIEAAGLGILLRPGDVALRGNFATVDGGGIVRDRRAGRIRVVEPLVKPLDGIELDGVTFMVKAGTAHRTVVVMRVEGLSASVTDADRHDPGARDLRVRPAESRRFGGRGGRLSRQEDLHRNHRPRGARLRIVAGEHAVRDDRRPFDTVRAQGTLRRPGPHHAPRERRQGR